MQEFFFCWNLYLRIEGNPQNSQKIKTRKNVMLHSRTKCLVRSLLFPVAENFGASTTTKISQNLATPVSNI